MHRRWLDDRRDGSASRQRLLRVDVLIIDELGFVPFDRVGGELLFNLITDRYERRATLDRCGDLARGNGLVRALCTRIVPW